MRLDDVDYINARLDGIPEPPGQQPPLQYYQGEDIVFEVLLRYQGKVVTLDNWDIDLIIKKNAFAKCSEWLGSINNGLYVIDHTPGYYKIIIPADVTSNLLAGTYWLNIFIHEKVGMGKGPKDLNIIIVQQPFSLDYAAASPNPPPALRGTDIEKTYPPPINITNY